MKPTPLTFKIASHESEFEQIARLNYETFVTEIPQHAANAAGVLHDRFHAENTYVIALRGDRLEGMLAVRGRRPFSLDARLLDLDSHLPPARRICEIRLLAVRREGRTGVVFRGLLETASEHCLGSGYDLAILSGTVRQTKLYAHLGCVAFGPLVGTPGAEYQPMYLTPEAFRERSRRLARKPRETREHRASRPAVNLLPGPVRISPAVAAAFAAPPVSHRGRAFRDEMSRTRRALCRLTGAGAASIFVGTGTLANDVIAAQLSLEQGQGQGQGCILSNGEFGDRLLDHAERCRLPYTAVRSNWGETLDLQSLEELVATRRINWVWAVHCETSTGVLNDLDALRAICEKHGIRLCLDCVSSIGSLDLDLSAIYLASAGSGKALGAFPGLGIVFANHTVLPAPGRLPRYLDLGLYAAADGSPFTHSSNLLAALKTAAESLVVDDPDANQANGRRLARRKELSAWLRAELRAAGFQVVAAEASASPAVTTVALPPCLSSQRIGEHLEEAGYLLSYGSDYLLQRNWIQICIMSDTAREEIVSLPGLLQGVCA